MHVNRLKTIPNIKKYVQIQLFNNQIHALQSTNIEVRIYAELYSNTNA